MYYWEIVFNYHQLFLFPDVLSFAFLDLGSFLFSFDRSRVAYAVIVVIII